jgi:hypothetical protein
MAVNRSIWRTRFARGSFPGLPCPRCPQGKLKLVPNNLSITEPLFSKASHSHPDFDPSWVEGRFVARMECDETKCGEIVFMVGDTEYVETYLDGEEYSWGDLEEVLQARGVFPAPPLFRIPNGVPRSVAQHLRLAFQLFWTDIPSCVARLRTSVELMLDEENVAKEQLSKIDGKMVRLTLHQRIVRFESQATGADAADSLHALRNVGNLGTHGSSVSPEALFDAVDVLEDVLLGVYEKKSIKAKAKRLIDTKGDYDVA